MGLAENKIHQGDCVKLLERIEPGSVDLAFADPPFNIGYEYDVYHDRKSYDEYLDWTRRWMSGVCRALKATGTFWIAIGDEYAAEFKLIAQNDLKLTCRSWVIWYYTFGVNCTRKFNRSHAHLFHFVRDPEQFTFNAADPAIRVPSARQLVYADARANPKGRLPDDTWILRPQDVENGFSQDQDTWYFPRVAGTFKERAGFHGCQMPEQLLGRIIRASSNEGDLVLDPFAGSATTLATAKKLGRRWLGFELSKEYAAKATARVAAARVGQSLDGAEEPLRSAPATREGRKLETVPAALNKTAKSPKNRQQTTLNGHSERKPATLAEIRVAPSAPSPPRKPRRSTTAEKAESTVALKQVTSHCQNGSTTARKSLKIDDTRVEGDRMVIESYLQTRDGFSADRVVADPVLNGAFVDACRCRGLAGRPVDWNRTLFRLRKAGRLPRLECRPPQMMGRKEMDPFSFASEIALQQLTAQSDRTLDEVLCDPTTAAQFDQLAAKFAPGYTPLQYRWAAIDLRKRTHKVGQHARARLRQLNRNDFPRAKSRLRVDFESLMNRFAVYLLRSETGRSIYVGETYNLGARLRTHFEDCEPTAWGDSRPVAIRALEVAEEHELLETHLNLAQRYAPALNYQKLISA